LVWFGLVCFSFKTRVWSPNSGRKRGSPRASRSCSPHGPMLPFLSALYPSQSGLITQTYRETYRETRSHPQQPHGHNNSCFKMTTSRGVDRHASGGGVDQWSVITRCRAHAPARNRHQRTRPSPMILHKTYRENTAQSTPPSITESGVGQNMKCVYLYNSPVVGSSSSSPAVHSPFSPRLPYHHRSQVAYRQMILARFVRVQDKRFREAQGNRINTPHSKTQGWSGPPFCTMLASSRALAGADRSTEYFQTDSH